MRLINEEKLDKTPEQIKENIATTREYLDSLLRDKKVTQEMYDRVSQQIGRK